MTIQNITVIGSGAMGAGIAQVAMLSGFTVTLNDLSMDILIRAKNSIEKQLERSASKGRITKEQLNVALANLLLETDLKTAGKNADMVIEAAIEDVEIKKNVFRQISEVCGAHTIFASNTSSIPITEIASVVPNPSHFLGMHFFNPAPVMKLLELVRGMETSDETLKAAKEVGERMNKVTIVAEDRTGFIVNRLIDPFLNEAIYLVEDGVGTVEDIDKGTKFGLNHLMGPLELADMIGLDVLLAVMEVFYREFSDTKYRPCPLLRRMVRAGHLGRKTGKGFYDYTSKI